MPPCPRVPNLHGSVGSCADKSNASANWFICNNPLGQAKLSVTLCWLPPLQLLQRGTKVEPAAAESRGSKGAMKDSECTVHDILLAREARARGQKVGRAKSQVHATRRAGPKLTVCAANIQSQLCLPVHAP